jgi:uncharacterized protein (TIGR02118 family)
MFKAIGLLKSKAGLSRDAFVEYYETRHAPLMLECLPQIIGYRRNYVDLAGAYIYPGATTPDFDAVVELWFADRASYDAAMATFAQPEISERVARDEENFLDRDLTRFFVVEERISATRA